MALNGLAEKEGIVLDVHLEIDTGMGRYGFEPSELERILSVFRFMGNLNVTGVFTHFPSAFCSRKATRAQYDRLLDVAAKTITLSLSINTEMCAVMDYFEIFLQRMLLCRRAAEQLGLNFRLEINGQLLL